MKNLKDLRLARGLSQQRLADQLHLSQQSIYKYENDLSEPGIEILKNIADFFDTCVDYLIEYTDCPRKYDTFNETDLNTQELEHMRMYRLLPPDVRSDFDSLMEKYVREDDA